MKKIWIFLAAFTVFYFQNVSAVEINAELPQQDLTESLQVFDDSTHSLAFQSFNYSDLKQTEIKRSYTEETLWLKIDLSNSSEKNLSRILYFSAPLTGYVNLYSGSHPEQMMKSGSSLPIPQRAVRSRLTAFSIELPAHSQQSFYLQRQSHHSLVTKILLADPPFFQNLDTDSKAFLFFYLGGILCLVVYNLFIGIFARDENFLLYSAFALSFCLAGLSLTGVVDAYILPNLNFTLSHYLMFFASLAQVSAVIFVFRFLDITKTLPETRKIFYVLGFLGLVTLFAGLFSGQHPHPRFFGNLVDFNILLSTVFLIGCGVWAHRRAYPLAKFLILSWLPVFAGVMVWFAMMTGTIENSFLAQHALIIGNLAEMLILSLGLAYKINILDQKVAQAQSQIRENERYHLLVKVLSHDIANALAIIGGYVFRLRKSGLEPNLMKSVDKIHDVVSKVRETLSFVRDEEKLKSFQESAKLEPVDLHEVIHELVHYYEEHLQQKNLKVKSLVPELSRVNAEKSVLSNQVISNLFSNAIKFSRENGEITFAFQEDPSTVSLFIRDQGVGIPKEMIKRVFFSDEMVSTSGTSAEKGSGIGTSLVREYMQMFKGEIYVDSIHESTSPNSGTTVTLKFPRLSDRHA